MEFRGDYFFLSNFFPCDVALTINGKSYVFKDVEAAFQAQKNVDLLDRFILISGKEAKQLGRKIPITTPNWNSYRLYAMAAALHSKFTNNYLLTRLKMVKGYIEETNFWKDEFWGVCKGKGKNMLGKLLMNIRDNNNDLNKLNEYITEFLVSELVSEVPNV